MPCTLEIFHEKFFFLVKLVLKVQIQQKGMVGKDPPCITIFLSQNCCVIHLQEPHGKSEHLQNADSKPGAVLRALLRPPPCPHVQSRGGIVTSAKKPVLLLRGLSKGYLTTAMKETPRKLVSETGLQLIKKETGREGEG